MEERFAGKWWLPSDSSVVRTGTLTLTERNSVTLELNGSFGGRREIAFRPITADVIHGTLDDGRAVTLIDCRHGVVNAFAQEYFSRGAFLGAHLTTATALREVRFTGSQLDNFLGAPAGLRSDARVLGVRAEAVFRGLRTTFAVVRSDEAALVDNQPRSRITLFDVPDWPAAWEAIKVISLFLTLAAGEENAVMDIEAVPDDTSAQVIVPTRTVAHTRAADRRRDWLMWTLGDLPALESTLAKFDAFQAAMHHSLESFVAYLREPGDIAPASSRITQVLESYHRDRKNQDGTKRYSQQKMTDDTFGAIRTAFEELLVERFPDQKSMVSQLQKQPSMKDRLLELATEHAELLNEIGNTNEVVRDAKDNRNVFSHAGKANMTPSRVEKIFWSGERQRFLFYAILLTELGFSKDDAYHLIRRNRTFDLLTEMRE